MVAALPLMLLDIKDPRPDAPAWNAIPAQSPDSLDTVDVAVRMLFVENDADTLFFFARLMMVAVALVLGVFIFKWSQDLFGMSAAIVSLFIYALDPNILAYSQLVHTDLPFAACFFIGSYYFCRALDRLDRYNLAMTVVCFALAAITKYSYTVMFFVWMVLGTIKIFSSQPLEFCVTKSRVLADRWRKASMVGLVLVCALLGAYLLVWAVYGFRFAAVPGGMMPLALADELPQLAPLRTLFAYLAQRHWFPEAWIYGQLHAFGALGRDIYLLGANSIGKGFWLYFPTAFAVKTPVPTLLLLCGTIFLWLTGRTSWRQSVTLLAPAIVYFVVAVVSGINIGLRHIISIYPFIFVVLGGGVAQLWNSARTTPRCALAVGAVWYVLSALLAYPHYLVLTEKVRLRDLDISVSYEYRNLSAEFSWVFISC